MAATEAQIESLKRARDARAAKKNKQDNVIDNGVELTPFIDDEHVVWRDAFFVAMRSVEVRHANDLMKCIPIANKVVEIFKEQGKL